MKILERLRKLIRHNLLPENRSMTFLEIFQVCIWMFSTVIFYKVFGDSFPKIELLNFDNAVVIVSSFFIVDGLLYSLLYRNLRSLPERIQTRQFDNYLLIPGNLMNYVSFRQVQLSSMIQIPTALCFMFIWGKLLWGQFALWLVSLALGFLIAYLIWYSLICVSYWSKVGLLLNNFHEEIESVGMFPARIFMGSRIALFFFPFLTYAALPAEGYIQGNVFGVILIQLAVLVVMYPLAVLLTKWGVRRYRK